MTEQTPKEKLEALVKKKQEMLAKTEYAKTQKNATYKPFTGKRQAKGRSS